MCFSEASIFLSPRSARRESATAYATRMSTLLNASSISRSDGGCRMVRSQKSASSARGGCCPKLRCGFGNSHIREWPNGFRPKYSAYRADSKCRRGRELFLDRDPLVARAGIGHGLDDAHVTHAIFKTWVGANAAFRFHRGEKIFLYPPFALQFRR